jgi:lipopolysaccharide export system protein LptA
VHRCGTSRRGLRVLLIVAGLAASGKVTQAAGPAAAPPPVSQPAAEPAEKPAAAQPPVRISADAAEYLNQEGLVVFTGNVVAAQADSTLTADRMEVRFSQPEKAEGKPAAGIAEPGAGRRIASITALSNVSFRQVDPETKKERYATGDKGVYDADRRLVTMTGSPRLWDGKNVIVGDEMNFHLDDRKVVVTGKVNLTVYPDEAKEAKKP